MQVRTLIKALQEVVRRGGANKPVVIDKDTLYDGNGTFGLCAIQGVEMLTHPLVDGDGASIVNKDGTERCVCSVVLTGANK